jgi:hypothetical protein
VRAIAREVVAGDGDDLALSAMLRPFRDATRAGLHLIEDTAGQAASEAWEAFLAYYGTLSGMKRHLPALEGDLDGVVEFMRHPRG